MQKRKRRQQLFLMFSERIYYTATHKVPDLHPKLPQAILNQAMVLLTKINSQTKWLGQKEYNTADATQKIILAKGPAKATNASDK